MNLLEKYKQAKSTVSMMENGFRSQLKPYKDRADKLCDDVELSILKNDIFMSFEDMIKLSGHINHVNMIIEYGEGYRKIEKFLFDGFTIEDGKLIDVCMYPPRYKWVRDNIYTYGGLGGNSSHSEIKVLGCYDLNLDGTIVLDSRLEVLWKEK